MRARGKSVKKQAPCGAWVGSCVCVVWPRYSVSGGSGVVPSLMLALAAASSMACLLPSSSMRLPYSSKIKAQVSSGANLRRQSLPLSSASLFSRFRTPTLADADDCPCHETSENDCQKHFGNRSEEKCEFGCFCRQHLSLLVVAHCVMQLIK
ncbi:MAG: hypothetical protein UU49_C0037G0003 [Candidatus Magasanikbacteria bacterium GW2011_GWC2_41_17]|uniref:Uncharacterized protein n=1 Tax=Candidatus Magasanikbacteria bacterium GW2011_GWC2_41_17 TaxID=1619048 RepID=A0A0G0Y9H7_9BACT|nr:MAG: hypothetical protein UU49_C0037G0003 [Candidatus Magasanikbacteria bacterium GW2011_GWC2_41_17]